jgi:hypothetical protein
LRALGVSSLCCVILVFTGVLEGFEGVSVPFINQRRWPGGSGWGWESSGNR